MCVARSWGKWAQSTAPGFRHAGWWPPFLEPGAVSLGQQYLQLAVPLFSACVEVLVCSSFPKGFYNYILSWILSRVSLAFRIVFFSFFVFLWIEVENYLELPLGSPRKSDIGGKVARGQEGSGRECPAVPRFLPLVARHAPLRAEGLTGASSPPECVCVCACACACVLG